MNLNDLFGPNVRVTEVSADQLPEVFRALLGEPCEEHERCLERRIKEKTNDIEQGHTFRRRIETLQEEMNKAYQEVGQEIPKLVEERRTLQDKLDAIILGEEPDRERADPEGPNGTTVEDIQEELNKGGGGGW